MRPEHVGGGCGYNGRPCSSSCNRKQKAASLSHHMPNSRFPASSPRHSSLCMHAAMKKDQGGDVINCANAGQMGTCNVRSWCRALAGSLAQPAHLEGRVACGGGAQRQSGALCHRFCTARLSRFLRCALPDTPHRSRVAELSASELYSLSSNYKSSVHSV